MKTVVIERRKIDEHVIANKRCGRHVNHDSRSKAFRTKMAATIVTKKWNRITAILNQGDLGACTGNATTGALGSEPFYVTIQKAFPKLDLDENEAVKLYSLATQLDNYKGQYPPTDTGSDGLSVAKAAQQSGLISGYVHALSLQELLSGLQTSPMIVGTNWYEGMDKPNSSGLVVPTGSVRGGHEYCCVGLDVDDKLLYFDNSWGTEYGVKGTFSYSYDSMTKLLAEDGDATQFVPLTEAAPTPTPSPTDPDEDLIKAMDPWAKTVTSTKSVAGKAKDAYELWKDVHV